jgi:acetyltransferase-like isoleucine patch superfamily enzyme
MLYPMAYEFIGGINFNLIEHPEGFKYSPTAIIRDDCKIGRRTMIWHYANMYGCEIGEGSMIGSHTEIQDHVKIGNNTRIQSHSFLCSKVEVGNDVFIDHGVMTINDVKPPSGDPTKWKGTTIEDRVMIGSNSTLFPVKIGEAAVIGAGSVVTKDVPEGRVVIGNPAKIVGLSYKLTAEELELIKGTGYFNKR